MFSSKRIIQMSSLFAVSNLIVLAMPVLAQMTTSIQDQAEWIMQIDARSVNTVCIGGSAVQVQVSSRKVGDLNQNVFEEFYFSNGNAVGLKKQGDFPLPPEQKVSIRVDGAKQTCTSTDESRALAGSILRVVLSLLLNHDQVAQVILPDANYSAITSELKSRRGILLPTGECAPDNARVKFELQSASAHIKQTIYFQ